MSVDLSAPDRLLTTEEAAEVLAVKAQTLAAWRCLKRHDLHYVKTGRLVRYRLSDLLAWLERRTVAPVVEA